MPVNPYNEGPRNWVGRHRPAPDPALTVLARRAVERVGTESSELAEQWAGDEEWRGAMAELLSRLA